VATPIKRGTAWRLGIRRPPSFARGGWISTRVDGDIPLYQPQGCVYPNLPGLLVHTHVALPGDEMAAFIREQIRIYGGR
jgi:hypothetical protein